MVYNIPWAIDAELCCQYIHLDWIPHDLLVSALCPVMIFCSGFRFLQRFLEQPYREANAKKNQNFLTLAGKKLENLTKEQLEAYETSNE